MRSVGWCVLTSLAMKSSIPRTALTGVPSGAAHVRDTEEGAEVQRGAVKDEELARLSSHRRSLSAGPAAPHPATGQTASRQSGLRF